LVENLDNTIKILSKGIFSPIFLPILASRLLL